MSAKVMLLGELSLAIGRVQLVALSYGLSG